MAIRGGKAVAQWAKAFTALLPCHMFQYGSHPAVCYMSPGLLSYLSAASGMHHPTWWTVDSVGRRTGIYWCRLVGVQWHECWFEGHMTKLRQNQMCGRMRGRREYELSSFSNRGLIVSVLATKTRAAPLICLSYLLNFTRQTSVS